MTSASLPWNADEDLILLVNFTALFVSLLLSPEILPVSCVVFRQKTLYWIWKWLIQDFQGRSGRRWSLWPLTLLWGQTDSVIWRYGHPIPFALITVQTWVLSQPSRLAFLIEHPSWRNSWMRHTDMTMTHIFTIYCRTMSKNNQHKKFNVTSGEKRRLHHELEIAARLKSDRSIYKIYC